MEGRLAEGWGAELEGWVEPFLARLRRKAQRRWAPFYLKGLILPGERKSIEPMAARVAPADIQQLHHFVSTSPWPTAPLEEELVRSARPARGRARRRAGRGRHGAGEAGPALGRREAPVLRPARQAGQLPGAGLAHAGRAEVPVCVGLRLFLPEDWCADAARRTAAGVPEAIGYRPKWQIALDEIDRVLASGARFGCVLADAEYGKAAEFRAGLGERQLAYAVGILPTQKVYPADVTLAVPERKATGRPRKHPVPSAASVSATELIEARPETFRSISWRTGTKGPLKAEFAARRVRVADGPVAQAASTCPARRRGSIGEHRATGERKYYLTNLPPDASLETLAALIKARWVCEQMHQQMKDELGLDHFEGRSWRGLHHHALLCQLAFAFLQHLRLGGKKRSPPRPSPGRHRSPSLPAIRRRIVAALTRVLLRCPHCRQRFAPSPPAMMWQSSANLPPLSLTDYAA